MSIRLLNVSHRSILREATLANINWCGPRLSFGDLDLSKELAHYYSNFPRGNDFGMLDESGGEVRAVAWLVFFSAEHPGYGFVEEAIPELSITTFEGFRGQGIGAQILRELIAAATERGVPGISLSVEDGNRVRSLYSRLGFEVVGRSGDSDTMLLRLPTLGVPPHSTKVKNSARFIPRGLSSTYNHPDASATRRGPRGIGGLLYFTAK